MPWSPVGAWVYSVWVTAVPANGLVLWCLVSDKRLWKQRATKLVAAQISIDLISVISFIAVAGAYFGGSSGPPASPSAICSAFGALIHTGCIASMLTLTLMSVERYQLIVARKPLSRHAVVALFCCGIGLAILCGLSGLGAPGGSYVLNESMSICYTSLKGPTVCVISALAVVTVCIGVLGYCYGAIALFIFRTAQAVKGAMGAAKVADASAAPRAAAARPEDAALRAAKGMVQLVLAFLVFWTPMTIRFVVGAANVDVPGAFDAVASVIATCNFLMAPVITTLNNGPVRRRLAVMFCGKRASRGGVGAAPDNPTDLSAGTPAGTPAGSAEGK